MKKKVTIIGGGPAAIMAAINLDENLFDVHLFEQNKTLGRKFLVAGKGGFNLTHGEEMTPFVERFTPASFTKEALLAFDNDALRGFLADMKIPTFAGSSNRIYPEKQIKPIEVLQVMIAKMESQGVTIHYNKKWTGWANEELTFEDGESVKSDIQIFAMGGGSWKVTGSNGHWLKRFTEKSVKTNWFKPANCAYKVEWSEQFTKDNAGKPLKNITITCEGNSQKGEAVITSFGIEGNALYAMSPQIQPYFDSMKSCTIHLDFKPMFTLEEVIQKLEGGKKSITYLLRKALKLSDVQVDLLFNFVPKDDYLNPEKLAKKIKAFPMKLTAAADLNEAISTTGGIDLGELTENFELKNHKNIFCIGEMSDWNAPTGGYLLQACFSMGVKTANHLNSVHKTQD
ncbi:MAG: putative flavoprotein (TIGR03862 family) [Sphingobacteriales bacterium]|jgi:uncharacterized flavoprotein (TIGR03862 family)